MDKVAAADINTDVGNPCPAACGEKHEVARHEVVSAYDSAVAYLVAGGTV